MGYRQLFHTKISKRLKVKLCTGVMDDGDFSHLIRRNCQTLSLGASDSEVQDTEKQFTVPTARRQRASGTPAIQRSLCFVVLQACLTLAIHTTVVCSRVAVTRPHAGQESSSALQVTSSTQCASHGHGRHICRPYLTLSSSPCSPTTSSLTLRLDALTHPPDTFANTLSATSNIVSAGITFPQQYLQLCRRRCLFSTPQSML